MNNYDKYLISRLAKLTSSQLLVIEDEISTFTHLNSIESVKDNDIKNKFSKVGNLIKVKF